MKVSDFIVSELIRLGVRRYYCVPGGNSMYLNDAMGHSALQPIYCLHESGAAFAAHGEAAYTGKLSVCLVTSGPGSTNALTGCASAWCDSLPVLFISGDTRTPLLDDKEKYGLRQAGQQDVSIIEMVRTITKHSAIVGLSSEWVKRWFSVLADSAMTPRRGPVWLNIPLDVQKMNMEDA